MITTSLAPVVQSPSPVSHQRKYVSSEDQPLGVVAPAVGKIDHKKLHEGSSFSSIGDRSAASKKESAFLSKLEAPAGVITAKVTPQASTPQHHLLASIHRPQQVTGVKAASLVNMFGKV